MSQGSEILIYFTLKMLPFPTAFAGFLLLNPVVSAPRNSKHASNLVPESFLQEYREIARLNQVNRVFNLLLFALVLFRLGFASLKIRYYSEILNVGFVLGLVHGSKIQLILNLFGQHKIEHSDILPCSMI